MDLIKGTAAALLAVVVVAFGLTVGTLLSVAFSIVSLLAGIGLLITGVAYAIYDAFRSPSP